MIDLLIESKKQIAFLQLKDIDWTNVDLRNTESVKNLFITAATPLIALDDKFKPINIKPQLGIGIMAKAPSNKEMDKVKIKVDEAITIAKIGKEYHFCFPFETWFSNARFSNAGVMFVDPKFDLSGYLEETDDLKEVEFRLKLIQKQSKTRKSDDE